MEWAELDTDIRNITSQNLNFMWSNSYTVCNINNPKDAMAVKELWVRLSHLGNQDSEHRL